MYNICWFKNVGVQGTPHINKQINIVLFIYVRFYFSMKIDSELSERSLFSGSIIYKHVYSIKKTHNKYYMYVGAKVEWSCDLSLYMYCFIFRSSLYFNFIYDSVTDLRMILLIYFSMPIWRLIKLTEIDEHFIVNHCC